MTRTQIDQQATTHIAFMENVSNDRRSQRLVAIRFVRRAAPTGKPSHRQQSIIRRVTHNRRLSHKEPSSTTAISSAT
jgi:hypothetical protein